MDMKTLAVTLKSIEDRLESIEDRLERMAPESIEDDLDD